MVAFVRLCIIKSLPLRLYAFSPLVSIGSHSLKQSMGCSERDVGSASINPIISTQMLDMKLLLLLLQP